MDLVLITSLVKTPNTPLSYSNIRSVFSHDERFEQVKKSIQSVREKIEGAKILLIECSDLSEEQRDYFKNNCDYFYNLYDKENRLHYLSRVYSTHKTLGELTLTTEALKYIYNNNLEFKNFYKLSGRYWINDRFDINKFENNRCHVNHHTPDCLATCLYKLDNEYTLKWYNYLLNQESLAKKGFSMENFFAYFIMELYKDENHRKNILLSGIGSYGVSGLIAVDGSIVDF